MHSFSPLRPYPPLPTLLLGSLLHDLGKGIASPLMVLFLTSSFALNSWQAGGLLGLAMLLATLLSLPAGLLFDWFDRRRLATAALLLMALAVALLPFAQIILIVSLLLVFMEFAAALFSIGLKALLADFVKEQQRVQAFSYRYILTNVAFAIGPILGVRLAEVSLTLALLVAAGASCLAMVIIMCLSKDQNLSCTSLISRQLSLAEVPRALGKDRNLVLYTLGSFFNTVVHGRFTFFLSLLLLYKYPATQGMETLSLLLLTNAATVILLQRVVSRYITLESLNSRVVMGALLFSAGLLGFSVSEQLSAWCVSMLIFTLGELLIQPAEYLYIDSISPPHLKGSYFAAHNLASLGAAVSPAWCGFMLSLAGPKGLCYSLIVCVLVGGSLCAMRPRLLPTHLASR
ncbi:MFS transporter [Pseudomonas soli]|uniref:MFS transporter n=1 Tax=Pseudomonas soli TaxID=1306993 RepID=UPI00382468EA